MTTARPFPDRESAARCVSCEHEARYHDVGGRCWFTVEQGAPGRDAVCSCLTRRVVDEGSVDGPSASNDTTDATARPWHAVLLAHLRDEWAKAERGVAQCRREDAMRANEGMEIAFRIAIAHTVRVYYGPDAVSAYLRDGTLPETVGGEYETVLTAELTRLARTMIDPGTGSDVGDQVAIVMGIRDQHIRQMEAEVAENTGVMQALRRQRDEAENTLTRVREYLEASDDDGVRTRETVLRMLGEAAPETPVQRLQRLQPERLLEKVRRNQQADAAPQHIGGNAEDCPGCDGTNPPYPFICPGPGDSTAKEAS